MHLISKLALAGLGLAALSGGAAAAQDTHILNVALPDGSVARIHYEGDKAPQVRVVPVRQVAVPIAWADPFADFDRVFAEMDRQMDAMMQQARMVASQPAASADAKPDLAALRTLPPGTVSYSFISTSTGNGTCAQSVQYISDGSSPPKMVKQSSGDCSAMGQAPAKASTPPASKPAPAKTADRDTA